MSLVNENNISIDTTKEASISKMYPVRRKVFDGILAYFHSFAMTDIALVDNRACAIFGVVIETVNCIFTVLISFISFIVLTAYISICHPLEVTSLTSNCHILFLSLNSFFVI